MTDQRRMSLFVGGSVPELGPIPPIPPPDYAPILNLSLPGSFALASEPRLAHAAELQLGWGKNSS